MMIELMTITVPRGKKQEFGRDLVSLFGPIRVQPGCLSCRVFHAWPDNDELHIEARWRNREDLVQHLQSDVYKKLLLLLELGAAKPTVEFFDVVECRGLDLVRAARSSLHESDCQR